MSQLNTFDPINFYKEIETLYNDENYSSILEFEGDCLSSDLSKLESEKRRRLAEMFSRAYIRTALGNKRFSIISQYKMSLRYEKYGGSDSDILNWKLRLEEDLFMRYVKVNRFILFLILIAFLLENLNLLPSAYNFLPFLTAIAVIWYLLNYVMNCRVKRLYLKLMRYIYSRI